MSKKVKVTIEIDVDACGSLIVDGEEQFLNELSRDQLRDVVIDALGGDNDVFDCRSQRVRACHLDHIGRGIQEVRSSVLPLTTVLW